MWYPAPIFALAVAGMVSAAVHAVDTSFPSSIAIEHFYPRALAQSGEYSTSTTTTTSTSTTWETITVALAPTLPSTFSTPTSISIAHTITSPGSTAPDTTTTSVALALPSTLSSNSSPLGSTMMRTTPGIHQNIAGHGITSTIVQTIVVTVVAQPIITTYASPVRGAGFIDNHARTPQHDRIVSSIYNRDDGAEPAGYGSTPEFTTSYTTATIPASTKIVYMTGMLPPVATGYSYNTLFPAAAPVTSILPPGVTVVNVTVLSTVTMPTSGAISAVEATSWSIAEPSSAANTTNNATSATTSYLNISTFVATGLVNLTSSSTSSQTTTCSSETSANSKSVVAHTTTKPPTTDVGVPSGRITGIMPGSSGSGKTVDFGVLPVPILMFVGMGACFALALFL